MRLLFGFDLQTVLYPTEKPIGVIASQYFISRKKVQLAQGPQRLEHACFLQERMTRPVDQLQGLHDEFDFANTTASKLYVAFELVRADDVTLDTPLDAGDFIQQIGRRAFGINERLMLPQEFVSQFTTAADSARLDQCKAFPRFAEAGIVIFHARERTGQGTRGAFRPKAKIDAEK